MAGDLELPFRRPLPSRALVELTVAANFAEVFLAKEGHTGRVGINLLEKGQLATLPSLLGAMLADVDYVLMGAGIPRAIPGVLDRFAAGEQAELKIDVDGAMPGEEFVARLDPRDFGDGQAPRPTRWAASACATGSLRPWGWDKRAAVRWKSRS